MTILCTVLRHFLLPRVGNKTLHNDKGFQQDEEVLGEKHDLLRGLFFKKRVQVFYTCNRFVKFISWQESQIKEELMFTVNWYSHSQKPVHGTAEI